MFDQVLAAITEYPYVSVAVLFVLCGVGLPLPEEVLLLAAGYLCATYPERAELPWMMAACAGGILCGDTLPYVLGRVFGVRLLRLRWLRMMITKQRLANFDRWFRRRGDWVILIARFIPGLRVVAFFTAGSMKMAWRRFLFLDGLGIVLMVPALTLGGYHSAAFIERVIGTMQRVERGLLWGIMGGGVVLVVWFWVAQYRKRKARERRPGEAFVEPQLPVHESVDTDSTDDTTDDSADDAPPPATMPAGPDVVTPSAATDGRTGVGPSAAPDATPSPFPVEDDRPRGPAAPD